MVPKGKVYHQKDNPLARVDKPKPARRLLRSVNDKEVDDLINVADNLRDKCIISLFADSGMRLNELADTKLMALIGALTPSPS